MANLAAARGSLFATSRFLGRIHRIHTLRTFSLLVKRKNPLFLTNQQKHVQTFGVSSTALRHRSYYENWTYLKYEDLVALIENGDDIVLIDVRDAAEIAEQGSFPNSLNIPLPQLKEALKMKDGDFEAKYKIPKPKVDGTNIVFAGYKSVKSNSATEIAHKLGYTKSRQYKNGYEEWHAKKTGTKYDTGDT